MEQCWKCLIFILNGVTVFMQFVGSEQISCRTITNWDGEMIERGRLFDRTQNCT